MKTKTYVCSVCGQKFELTKDTDVAELREAITKHSFVHFTRGENAHILAEDYRANYTCIECGAVFNIGSKGAPALEERITEHRKVCNCPAIIPAEFVTQEEIDAYQSLNMDAGE